MRVCNPGGGCHNLNHELYTSPSVTAPVDHGASFTAVIDGIPYSLQPIGATPNPGRKARKRKRQHQRACPAVLSLPGPGRYFVHVSDDGNASIKTMDGLAIVDADGAVKLQADIARVREALTELSRRMRIATGEECLSAVAQPL